MLTNKLKSPCDAKNRYYFSSDPVDLKALWWWPLHFQTIFSNIWPLSVAVGQGYPDVNNNETNYDDEDSNSPCHNCNVLVTEWDKWQDITYLWRQLMMWSVGRLWFPGDHYLPHWPMKPGSAAINESIAVLVSQNAIGNWWFMLVQYRPISRPSILWPRLDDASYSITESPRTLTAYPTKCRTFETQMITNMKVPFLVWVFYLVAVSGDDG